MSEVLDVQQEDEQYDISFSLRDSEKQLFEELIAEKISKQVTQQLLNGHIAAQISGKQIDSDICNLDHGDTEGDVLISEHLDDSDTEKTNNNKNNNNQQQTSPTTPIKDKISQDKKQQGAIQVTGLSKQGKTVQRTGSQQRVFDLKTDPSATKYIKGKVTIGLLHKLLLQAYQDQLSAALSEMVRPDDSSFIPTPATTTAELKENENNTTKPKEKKKSSFFTRLLSVFGGGKDTKKDTEDINNTTDNTQVQELPQVLTLYPTGHVGLHPLCKPKEKKWTYNLHHRRLQNTSTTTNGSSSNSSKDKVNKKDKKKKDTKQQQQQQQDGQQDILTPEMSPNVDDNTPDDPDLCVHYGSITTSDFMETLEVEYRKEQLAKNGPERFQQILKQKEKNGETFLRHDTLLYQNLIKELRNASLLGQVWDPGFILQAYAYPGCFNNHLSWSYLAFPSREPKSNYLGGFMALSDFGTFGKSREKGGQHCELYEWRNPDGLEALRAELDGRAHHAAAAATTATIGTAAATTTTQNTAGITESDGVQAVGNNGNNNNNNTNNHVKLGPGTDVVYETEQQYPSLFTTALNVNPVLLQQMQANTNNSADNNETQEPKTNNLFDIVLFKTQEINGYVDPSILYEVIECEQYDLYNQLTNYTSKLYPDMIYCPEKYRCKKYESITFFKNDTQRKLFAVPLCQRTKSPIHMLLFKRRMDMLLMGNVNNPLYAFITTLFNLFSQRNAEAALLRSFQSHLPTTINESLENARALYCPDNTEKGDKAVMHPRFGYNALLLIKYQYPYIIPFRNLLNPDGIAYRQLRTYNVFRTTDLIPTCSEYYRTVVLAPVMTRYWWLIELLENMPWTYFLITQPIAGIAALLDSIEPFTLALILQQLHISHIGKFLLFIIKQHPTYWQKFDLDDITSCVDARYAYIKPTTKSSSDDDTTNTTNNSNKDKSTSTDNLKDNKNDSLYSGIGALLDVLAHYAIWGLQYVEKGVQSIQDCQEERDGNNNENNQQELINGISLDDYYLPHEGQSFAPNDKIIKATPIGHQTTAFRAAKERYFHKYGYYLQTWEDAKSRRWSNHLRKQHNDDGLSDFGTGCGTAPNDVEDYQLILFCLNYLLFYIPSHHPLLLLDQVDKKLSSTTSSTTSTIQGRNKSNKHDSCYIIHEPLQYPVIIHSPFLRQRDGHNIIMLRIRELLESRHDYFNVYYNNEFTLLHHLLCFFINQVISSPLYYPIGLDRYLLPPMQQIQYEYEEVPRNILPQLTSKTFRQIKYEFIKLLFESPFFSLENFENLISAAFYIDALNYNTICDKADEYYEKKQQKQQQQKKKNKKQNDNNNNNNNNVNINYYLSKRFGLQNKTKKDNKNKRKNQKKKLELAVINEDDNNDNHSDDDDNNDDDINDNHNNRHIVITTSLTTRSSSIIECNSTHDIGLYTGSTPQSIATQLFNGYINLVNGVMRRFKLYELNLRVLSAEQIFFHSLQQLCQLHKIDINTMLISNQNNNDDNNNTNTTSTTSSSSILSTFFSSNENKQKLIEQQHLLISLRYKNGITRSLFDMSLTYREQRYAILKIKQTMQQSNYLNELRNQFPSHHNMANKQLGTTWSELRVKLQQEAQRQIEAAMNKQSGSINNNNNTTNDTNNINNNKQKRMSTFTRQTGTTTTAISDNDDKNNKTLPIFPFGGLLGQQQQQITNESNNYNPDDNNSSDSDDDDDDSDNDDDIDNNNNNKPTKKELQTKKQHNWNFALFYYQSIQTDALGFISTGQYNEYLETIYRPEMFTIDYDDIQTYKIKPRLTPEEKKLYEKNLQKQEKLKIKQEKQLAIDNNGNNNVNNNTSNNNNGLLLIQKPLKFSLLQYFRFYNPWTLLFSYFYSLPRILTPIIPRNNNNNNTTTSTATTTTTIQQQQEQTKIIIDPIILSKPLYDEDINLKLYRIPGLTSIIVNLAAFFGSEAQDRLWHEVGAKMAETSPVHYPIHYLLRRHSLGISSLISDLSNITNQPMQTLQTLYHFRDIPEMLLSYYQDNNQEEEENEEEEDDDNVGDIDSNIIQDENIEMDVNENEQEEEEVITNKEEDKEQGNKNNNDEISSISQNIDIITPNTPSNFNSKNNKQEEEKEDKNDNEKVKKENINKNANPLLSTVDRRKQQQHQQQNNTNTTTTSNMNDNICITNDYNDHDQITIETIHPLASSTTKDSKQQQSLSSSSDKIKIGLYTPVVWPYEILVGFDENEVKNHPDLTWNALYLAYELSFHNISTNNNGKKNIFERSLQLYNNNKNVYSKDYFTPITAMVLLNKVLYYYQRKMSVPWFKNIFPSYKSIGIQNTIYALQWCRIEDNQNRLNNFDESDFVVIMIPPLIGTKSINIGYINDNDCPINIQCPLTLLQRRILVPQININTSGTINKLQKISSASSSWADSNAIQAATLLLDDIKNKCCIGNTRDLNNINNDLFLKYKYKIYQLYLINYTYTIPPSFFAKKRLCVLLHDYQHLLLEYKERKRRGSVLPSHGKSKSLNQQQCIFIDFPTLYGRGLIDITSFKIKFYPLQVLMSMITSDWMNGIQALNLEETIRLHIPRGVAQQIPSLFLVDLVDQVGSSGEVDNNGNATATKFKKIKLQISPYFLNIRTIEQVFQLYIALDPRNDIEQHVL